MNIEQQKTAVTEIEQGDIKADTGIESLADALKITDTRLEQESLKSIMNCSISDEDINFLDHNKAETETCVKKLQMLFPNYTKEEIEKKWKKLLIVSNGINKSEIEKEFVESKITNEVIATVELFKKFENGSVFDYSGLDASKEQPLIDKISALLYKNKIIDISSNYDKNTHGNEVILMLSNPDVSREIMNELSKTLTEIDENGKIKNVDTGLIQEIDKISIIIKAKIKELSDEVAKKSAFNIEYTKIKNGNNNRIETLITSGKLQSRISEIEDLIKKEDSSNKPIQNIIDKLQTFIQNGNKDEEWIAIKKEFKQTLSGMKVGLSGHNNALGSYSDLDAKATENIIEQLKSKLNKGLQAQRDELSEINKAIELKKSIEESESKIQKTEQEILSSKSEIITKEKDLFKQRTESNRSKREAEAMIENSMKKGLSNALSDKLTGVKDKEKTLENAYKNQVAEDLKNEIFKGLFDGNKIKKSTKDEYRRIIFDANPGSESIDFAKKIIELRNSSGNPLNETQKKVLDDIENNPDELKKFGKNLIIQFVTTCSMYDKNFLRIKPADAKRMQAGGSEILKIFAEASVEAIKNNSQVSNHLKANGIDLATAMSEGIRNHNFTWKTYAKCALALGAMALGGPSAISAIGNLIVAFNVLVPGAAITGSAVTTGLTGAAIGVAGAGAIKGISDVTK